MFSFSTKSFQLKQHRQMLKIIACTHTRTQTHAQFSLPSFLIYFFFFTVSMCSGAPVIMTLYINPDPTITTSPRCSPTEQWHARRHTLIHVHIHTHTHTILPHTAAPPWPVQHLFSHSLPEPAHPFNYNRHL